MMMSFVVILLLLAIGTGIGFVMAGRLARQRRHSLEQLRDEREEIVQEERRLFSFLHALGAATTLDQRDALHRLIVEGAMRVTSSKGGALYLLDEVRQELVPKFCSDDCAFLIDLTEKHLTQAQANPSSLLSTLRWQVVPVSEGVLGAVFRAKKSQRVSDLAAHPAMQSTANEHQRGITALIGPLTSGGRLLGVLAVTANAADRHYTQNDHEVFDSLVEQSAFAQASANAHQEVQVKREMEAEMRHAGDVQRVLMPKREPVLAGFEIVGRNRPAKILSGDFYDYVHTQGQFGAVIADVCGKGLPAALVAAITRSALQAHAQMKTSPAAVLAAVNRQVSPSIREDMFVSMIYFTLEPGRPEVTVARAGHPNPLWWHRATNTVEAVQSQGMAVGIDDGDVFDRNTKDVTFAMEPGDVLLFYTDGVNEARSSDDAEFGEDRLKEVVCKAAPEGPRAVVDQLMAALKDFAGNGISHDDVTLIALRKE